MSDERTRALIGDLLKLPAETAWVEFKQNNADAEMIGKRISALSNAARLVDKPFAYMLWGVRDGDHAAVGTTFEPSTEKRQGSPLELWLAQRLKPGVSFQFQNVDYLGVRLRLCEEQGTGIDKVLAAVELHQLPPPDFRVEGDAVRAVLYAPRRFTDMTPQERVRACYQHAALKFVTGQRMTNATLRERLGIDPQNAAQASAIIKQSLKEKLIHPADPERPRAGYVPFWA